MQCTFKHLILDFDGVISDSFDAAREEVNNISAQYYPTIPRIETPDDMAHVYWGPLSSSLARFGLTDEQSREFFDRHSAAMCRRAEEIRPFEDVLRVLNGLPRQMCSIVTSSYSAAVNNILARSPNYQRDIFRFVQGRELRQPKSQKIMAIIDAIGIAPSDVLHVGDMVSDLIYSRAVVVPFCAVGWGYHPLWYLRGFDPDFTAESPYELSRLLDLEPDETP